jgi:hypothetical protein
MVKKPIFDIEHAKIFWNFLVIYMQNLIRRKHEYTSDREAIDKAQMLLVYMLTLKIKQAQNLVSM